MRVRIEGKFFDNSDDEQLYAFFIRLGQKFGNIQFEMPHRENREIRFQLPGNLLGSYSVMTILDNLTKDNSLRLGFATHVIISQGVNTPAVARLVIRPLMSSWVWEALESCRETKQSGRMLHFRDLTAYYDNHIMVDETRAEVLHRIVGGDEVTEER